MLKRINTFLEYAMLAIAFFVIFFTDYNYLLALSIFPAFAILWYFHCCDKKHNLKIPDYLYTVGIFMVYLNIFGEFFFEFYYTVPNYDKILHFIVPIYLVLVMDYLIEKKQKFRSFLEPTQKKISD